MRQAEAPAINLSNRNLWSQVLLGRLRQTGSGWGIWCRAAHPLL